MRLIICDLDGTLLLKGEEGLHGLTVSAIEKILDRGMIFCVASGRNYAELKKILKKFSDKIYFVANDGALIVQNEKTIFESQINKEILTQFDGEKSVVAHGKYLSFVKSESERFIRGIKEQYSGHIVEIGSLTEITEPIYKLSLYGKSGDDFGLYTVYSDNSVCEYVKSGTNKGTALIELLKILKISDTDVAAIGDGVNDKEMLELAGKSYVMASAPPKIRKIGDCIAGNFEAAAESLLEE